MERVVTFSTIAGISDTPQPIITATPARAVTALIEQNPLPPLYRLSQLETWRLIGLGIVGIAMIGVMIFGYNCWKSDCLLKRQSQ